MFSSSRLRTAGVVVATATLLTASAQTCPATCKKAVQYNDGTVMCFVCEDGYGLDTELRCVKGWENCGIAALGWGCGCATGYYKDPTDSKKCLPCDNPNCNCQASDPSKCTGCATGLGLNEDKTDCKPCTAPHCTDCDANYAECTSCEDRYVLYGKNNCVKCGDEHCTECSGTNPYDCTTCEEGRYWDTDTKACEQCKNNEGCATCTKNADGTTTCTRCRVGFNLNGPPECAKCPIEKCAFCFTDGQSCNMCYDGDNIYPTFGSGPNRCDRTEINCRNGSHHVTGTTMLLGIAAAAALLF